ncbi:MAG: TonB-dependent receptor [Flavobacteriales bacterium]|nr:TonB-dependent receptor [Flavobacteriales bacterium]
MSRQRIVFLIASFIIAVCAIAQTGIHGTVRMAGEKGGLLPGANVHWSGTSIGTSTDANGHFMIEQDPPQWPAQLVVSFVGFRSDTLAVPGPTSTPLSFALRSTIELRDVEVVERVQGTQLSTRTINATESIGPKELKRAACCDLSESFETNATVDVSFSDAISGTKTIRMLGLDGKYAQMSLENIPFVRGLSSSSGLTLIPGTWINNINLSKGTGTAVNGPNAMTGQIDLCLVNPLDQPPLFVNLYGNSQGRLEANIHTAQRTGKYSSNLLLLHGNWFDREMDQNNDGFMDMPRTRRVNVMDRWMYLGERKSGQVTLRVVDDQRLGGQSLEHLSGEAAHQYHLGRGLYTIDVTNRMVDGFGKHGWIFKNDPTKSIGLIVAVRQHEVDSRYGVRRYEAAQHSAYGSIVYQQLLGDGNDQIKAGLSMQYDDYDERFTNDTLPVLDLGRTERMPGAFAEHTLKRGRFMLVTGVRVDVNDLYGTVASPRVHAKYDLGPLTTVRASIGHGFRTSNPLAENAAVMASSRKVVVGPLDMERAWNLGASVLHKFKWLDRKWAIGMDAYRTFFTAQVVTDLDRDPGTLAIYMLDGRSYANSLLVDVQVDLTRNVQLKTSYRFYDVRNTFDGRELERPFTPSHRGLIDLAISDNKDRWHFDINLNIFGESRIPSTAANPEGLRLPVHAPAYSTLHAQLTRVFGVLEVYLGAENITSTLQQRQIIAPDDPFGPNFDASLIWGPTNKAMLYGGLRYTINRKTNATPAQ